MLIKFYFKKLEEKKQFGRPGQKWKDIVLILTHITTLTSHKYQMYYSGCKHNN
jgi:hypothetical protein